MLKVLIKKELSRFGAALSASGNNSKKKRKNKQSSGKGYKILMIFLWIIIFFSLAMAFAGMSAMLSDALLPAELDWLYFVLVGIAGLILSIIGNSFTAFSTLYKAKDNDLLLSMPIPSRYILVSRLSLIFIYGIVYSAIYMIPSYIVRALWRESAAVGEIICLILMIIIMAIFVTAISAALGWVLALISKRIRNKAAATTIFTLVFLAAYYFFYFRINTYLQQLTLAAAGIGESIESSVFGAPLVHFGKALCGNFVSVLVWLAIAIVLFAIVFRVLDRSFIRIATASEKSVSVKYDEAKQDKVKLESPKKALLRKELGRFVSSPTYMINCGLGIIALIAASVMLIIKREQLGDIISMFTDSVPELNEYMFLIIAGIACIMLSMIDIAAPSISLEGRNIWILKSLPVQAQDIFYAKTNLQMVLSLPPLIVFMIAYAVIFKADIADVTFAALISFIFIRLHSQLGVFLGLMFPKLDWTNEAVPVKQSIAVLISMFSGIIFVGAAAALYWFVLRKFVDASDMYIGLVVVMALGSRLFDRWFACKGAEKFAAL